jgi:NaMN:DMB phosphoribosyltransferase
MAARSGQRPPRDHNGIMAVFRGRVRRWRQDKPGGLAVIDIPLELVADLGGRRQMRIAGSLNGVPFAGSTMLVAGGGFCVGVSAAALRTCGASVGDEVDVRLERPDRGK